MIFRFKKSHRQAPEPEQSENADEQWRLYFGLTRGVSKPRVIVKSFEPPADSSKTDAPFQE